MGKKEFLPEEDHVKPVRTRGVTFSIKVRGLRQIVRCLKNVERRVKVCFGLPSENFEGRVEVCFGVPSENLLNRTDQSINQSAQGEIGSCF